MSNTTTTPVKYYGIYYTHPMTGKRCYAGRSYTSKTSAATVADRLSARWGSLNYFYAEVPA